jgi:3-deoxy-manno-octulosonate cytidylyltransferase (CMP-KDO synthetase)
MTKISIIIPTRLSAQRLPNKPLKLINKKEMILHVYQAAKDSSVGQVIVATPDEEIIKLVTSKGGVALKTSNNHNTGTDRVYELYDKVLKDNCDIIINLQGDMPNISQDSIRLLSEHMIKKKCEIGTLAGKIENSEELIDKNVVKVKSKNIINYGEFSEASDFFRVCDDKKKENIYHHIGIYAFTNQALLRYVSFERSKLELERNLEQLRALENNMKIQVGLIKDKPLSVDTEQDLEIIRKKMEHNE